jgi:hypothetical protein
MSRYEAMVDSCGTWFVIDRVRGAPMKLGRHSLVAMSRQDAVLLATMLEGGRPERRRSDCPANEVERVNFRSKVLRRTQPPLRSGR